ncbi:MAG TPA: tetratricopeptide repeat protein [Polyangia bacterium]|nr:tetratricopeptide repeat protein [Polyangia bacterium]
MKGYSAREVATLIGLTAAQVRSYVRAGFLSPERDPRGELVFSFQDVVLLRTAKGLVDARIAPRRVKRVLGKLRDQLPSGRPLTGVSIGAEGNKVVVRDGSVRWNPESGQALFDFDVAALARKVAPIVERQARAARDDEAEQTAEDWFDLGAQLEVCAPAEARDAYRRATELDPHHADAHVNLGRLLHEARELEAAEAHYRLALDARPDDATAAFNLGVVLEDLGRAADAIAAYRQTLAADETNADAHYNISRLYERAGEETAAIRHLKRYRKLTLGR